MAKKIRLGNCEACEGFVLVDIAGNSVTPIDEACRHCGADVDRDSVIDVPLTTSAMTEDAADVVCDDCGERWPEEVFIDAIDERDGCPSCNPDAYESLAADS